MIIWVSSVGKQVLGYISVDDFCAMTKRPLPADGAETPDGVELHRTEEHIFGALRTSQWPPTHRWSLARQRLERIPVERLKR
jgi:hypothetical protein